MARRNRSRALIQGEAGRETPAPAAKTRTRGALIVGAVVLGAAIGAWLLSGVLISRAAATRLPPTPDLSMLPAPVANEVSRADDVARRRPTAAAIGDLGIVYQASLLPAEALQAYAVAESLDPVDWRWPYYRGLILEERGDDAGARDAFGQVVLAASDHGLAQFHLAELAFKAGRTEEAEAGYRSTQSAGAAANLADGIPPRRAIPLSAHASFGLARLRLDRGEIDAGRAQLAEIVRAYPDFGSAQSLLLRLGKTVRTGAVDDGRAYVPPADPWLDVVVARSRHPDLLLKHAALAARAGDTTRRQWLVGRALDANPNGLDVLLEMASMLQAAGRHTEAFDFLRRAEAVAPGDHHTLVEQGKSLSELGRLAEAEAVLRRAVRVRDAAAEYNLATVLDRLDRWSEAREHYERALAIDPFHARAMNNLAIGFSRRGEQPRALALYRRAIEAAPDHADTYTNLGGALAGLGRFSEALAALDTAVSLDPGAADAHNNRGIALAQLGRLGEARTSFETALRLVPAHRDAHNNLAALSLQP